MVPAGLPVDILKKERPFLCQIFLIFAGVGFLVTCFGIFKIMKDYMKKLEKIDPPSQKAMTDEEK